MLGGNRDGGTCIGTERFGGGMSILVKVTDRLNQRGHILRRKDLEGNVKLGQKNRQLKSKSYFSR